jgi:glycerol-3-phosphate acyltransferase PlsY
VDLVLKIFLSLICGYLLGSLSPAYILGRLVKGIDIRTVNFRNAGTRNVKATLGLWPAAITAVIDTTKGVAALLVSQMLFGLPPALAAIPVAAAVAGHILPFYLGFRGGKGTATAIGVFIFLTSLQMAEGSFSPITFAALLLVALVFQVAARNGDVTGMVTFLMMTVITPIEMAANGYPPWGPRGDAALDTAISLFIFASITRTAVIRKTFRLERKVEIKPWRLIARPFALLFIPIDLLWGRRVVLLVIGVVSLVFILADIVRFLSKRSIAVFFKAAEARRFSSMTYFLVSVFVSFLAFPDEIPYLTLSFTTIGDLLGKLIGLRFGRTALYKEKTLEGSLGFFGGSVMTAYILSRLLPIPLLFVFLGAGFAALVELYFDLLDDNFSVSLLSGGLLYALRFFRNL